MDDSLQLPTDDELARRIRAGDEHAFLTLVRRYERSLWRLVRSRLGAVDAVQDVLQETLVHAWTGLRNREPRDVRPWLYQVARNRCSDHLRSSARREHAVGDETLATMVNRLGVADARRRETVDEVVAAFDALPANERRALQSFYIDGYSIREIAARHGAAPGTIKRRLSQGRDKVRDALVPTTQRRDIDMRKDNIETMTFPADRPVVAVERTGPAAADVDMRELTWWFVVPDLHDEVHWAEYQPTDGGRAWRLTQVAAMRTRRRAVIHGRECVEIAVAEDQLAADGVPIPPTTERRTRVWGRLADDEVEWLGVEHVSPEGVAKLYTFLDDHFLEEFGTCPRHVPAGDFLSEQSVGQLVRREGAPEQFADGVFTVTVGDASFRCTRVIEMSLAPEPWDVVIVAYIDANGRTVLFRRYDDARRDVPGTSRTRPEVLPHAETFVIDGCTYVHSFDYLTAAACGLASGRGHERMSPLGRAGGAVKDEP